MRICLLGLFTALGALAGQPALAAPISEKFGAWEKRCETPPGAQGPQCYAAETVTAAERPNVTLIIYALRTADHKATIFRIIAPLGALLTKGVGLSVGAQDFGIASFVRCLPNGCVAEAALDDKLLTALKGGGTASIKVFETPEEGIAVDLPLDGFKAAFESLP